MITFSGSKTFELRTYENTIFFNRIAITQEKEGLNRRAAYCTPFLCFKPTITNSVSTAILSNLSAFLCCSNP